MKAVSAVVLFFPTCFLVETILGGPFGSYGGLNVRLLLLGVSCLVLVFALLLRGRIAGAHRRPLLALVGFVLLNGLWIAIVPALTHTKVHWALREPHGFITLVLAGLALAVFRQEELARLVPRLQRLVVRVSLVLAVFQVSLWLLGTLSTTLRWVVPATIDLVFRGASDQFFVGEIGDGFFRVFWISTLWCLLSLFWLPVAVDNVRLRRLAQLLLLMDLFVAYSRGIWLGLIAGLLVATVTTLTRANAGRALTRFAVGTVVGLLTLGGILAATGALDRGIARFQSTTSRRDESIGARVEQAPFLLALWYEHPLVGSGYGAYSHANVRSQEAPYSYEHMPYALLAKLGLVGVLGSAMFFAWWGLTAWEVRRRAPEQVASFLGACVALLVSEMTNPMVLNFVSMTIFACLLLQWAALYGMAPHGYLPLATSPER